MRGYQVQGDKGIASLHAIELSDPRPAAGEVLVRVRACSLNFRDLGILRGGYPRNAQNPVIPISDMAGEIVELGAGVGSWKVGDRVTATLLRDWTDGDATDAALRTGFGGGLDGFLREKVALPTHCLLSVPASLSFEQAATLPCAAVTAWHALKRAGTRADQTLLLLGTGGVSVFGLQLGKALGCRCIMTSSSDVKLERARQLGADQTVNYKSHPEWHQVVRELTGGHGVDQVLEVGGAGTLAQSMAATRVGGTLSLIGVLARAEQQPSIFPAALDCLTIHGIYVGSRAMHQDLLSAIVEHRIEPVIDRVFPFSAAKEAYGYFASQSHVGKVVIKFE